MQSLVNQIVVPVEEETEYDNYASETKRVSEEEVLRKALSHRTSAAKTVEEPSTVDDSSSSDSDDEDPMSYFRQVTDS